MRNNKFNFDTEVANVFHGREWVYKNNPSEVMKSFCGRHYIFYDCIGKSGEKESSLF